MSPLASLFLALFLPVGFLLLWVYLNYRELWLDFERRYRAGRATLPENSIWTQGELIATGMAASDTRWARIGIDSRGVYIVRHPLLLRTRITAPILVPWSDLFMGRRRKRLRQRMELVLRPWPHHCIVLPEAARPLVTNYLPAEA